MQETIIITGASGGIGKAIAIEYSKKSSQDHKIKLFLFGRDKNKLEEILSIVKSNNSYAEIFSVDIENQALMEKYIYQISKNYHIDVLIACAGVSSGTLKQKENYETCRRIFDINLYGTLNTIFPAMEIMIDQNKLTGKSSNIAIISSMAGLIGISASPSYSASKSAIKIFSDAMRPCLRKYNIYVSTIIPGYVETPMTDVNKFPMPLKISAARAAKIIIKGIEKNQAIITFPKIMYFALKIVSILPDCVATYINSRILKK